MVCVCNAGVAGIVSSLLFQPYFKPFVITVIALIAAVEFLFFYVAGRNPGIIDRKLKRAKLDCLDRK